MQWFASVGLVLALGVGAAAANTPAAVIQPRPPTAGTQGDRGDRRDCGDAWGTALAPGTAVSRWVWPIEPNHVVVHGFDPPATRWSSGHRGVDIAAAVGTSVLAPTDGQVSFVGMVAGRPVLVLTHAGGLRSTFEPVSTTAAVGQLVRRGEAVGTVAAYPGHCAPASCLHWGVLRGATYLDPLALLAGRVILLPMR
jgi:murein DD-endopeptidase MepM/ murein hydrolase activator NlpD